MSFFKYLFFVFLIESAEDATKLNLKSVATKGRQEMEGAIPALTGAAIGLICVLGILGVVPHARELIKEKFVLAGLGISAVGVVGILTYVFK